MVYHVFVAFLLFVITHNQHAAIAASTKRVSDVMPTHFSEHISNRYGTEDIPEECVNKTYCTIKPTDYPEELFNNMFKGMKPIRLPTLMMETTLASRFGNPLEQDDCESSVIFDPIYQVRTKRNSKWMDVAQAPASGYEQRVRLEICDQPSAPCFNMFPPTSDMRVICTQKYSRWEMLVLNGTETVPLAVDLPTCCSCVYQMVSLDNRFGMKSINKKN